MMIKLSKKKSLDSILGVFTKTLTELSEFSDGLSNEQLDLVVKKHEIDDRLQEINKDLVKAQEVQGKIKNILGK